MFSSNMLMNRVRREAVKVAENFDLIARDQVCFIDEVYSRVGAVLVMGKEGAENDKEGLRIELAVLLSNVLKSYTAAFALVRSGWRLQPFLCIRNSYEGLGLVLHLFANWEDLPRYKNGKLKSTRDFDAAKKLIPQFGKLYGDLSENFVHVGRPFGYVQKGNLHSEDERELWLCLAHLTSLIWMTYQTVELVFYDYVHEKLFWNREGEQRRPNRIQAGAGYRLISTEAAEKLKNRGFPFCHEKLSHFLT